MLNTIQVLIHQAATDLNSIASNLAAVLKDVSHLQVSSKLTNLTLSNHKTQLSTKVSELKMVLERHRLIQK